MPPTDQHTLSRSGYKEDEEDGRDEGTEIAIWRQRAFRLAPSSRRPGDFAPIRLGVCFHLCRESSGKIRAVRLELAADMDVYSTRAVILGLQRSRTPPTKLTCESRFGEAGEEEGYQRLEENESRDCEPSIPIAGARWNWNWSSSSNNNNVG